MKGGTRRRQRVAHKEAKMRKIIGVSVIVAVMFCIGMTFLGQCAAASQRALPMHAPASSVR